MLLSILLESTSDLQAHTYILWRPAKHFALSANIKTRGFKLLKLLQLKMLEKKKKKRGHCLDGVNPRHAKVTAMKGGSQCKMKFSPHLIFQFIQNLHCFSISKVSKSHSVCKPQWLFQTQTHTCGRMRCSTGGLQSR